MDEKELHEDFWQFEKRFDELWREYSAANPDHFVISGLQLIKVSLNALRRAMENPDIKSISWANPFAVWPWTVELDDDLNPQFFTASAKDFGDEKATAEALASHLTRAKALEVLRGLSRDIVLYQNFKGYVPAFPEGLISELRPLRGRGLKKRIRRLTDPHVFSFDFRAAELDAESLSDKRWSSAVVLFSPLVIEPKKGEAYFPIATELKLRDCKPEQWSQGSRDGLWDAILRTIEDVTPEENFGFAPKLIPAFYTDKVTFTQFVKSKYVDRFKGYMGPFLDLQAKHLNETGEFTSVIGAASAPTWVSAESLRAGTRPGLRELLQVQHETNTFLRYGENWAVNYEGKLIILKDSKGLNYIAHLLRNPKKVFNIMELVSAVEGKVADEVGKTYQRMSDEQLEEYGLSKLDDLGNAGDILDKKAIEEYESELKRLKREIRKATKNGDMEHLAKLQRDKELYEQLLHKGKGLGERVRKASDMAERARKTVSRTYNSCLKIIKREHPSLGLHLSRSIKIGKMCSYEPEQDTPWIV